MALGHHLSVDSWIERTGTTSRLIVVRLHGRGYWTYGVDELVALAARQPLQLALLPGGRDPDPTLAALHHIPGRLSAAIAISPKAPDNADTFLRLSSS